MVMSDEKDGADMILVTGATGFVGNAVVGRLRTDKATRRVVVAVRRNGLSWAEGVLPCQVASLSPSTDWSVALKGVSAVVHCAARVHVMHDASTNPLAEFRRVN